MGRASATQLLVALVVASAIAPGAPLAAQEPNFGSAVVTTGSELFIGQPVNWYGPGAVYVYRRDSTGAWVEAARLFAPDSARKDDFGGALAVDGNTLIVGAPRKRDGAGVAYAFTRDAAGGAWRHTAVIEAPAGGDHTGFAGTLALSGDDLLVGSPEVDETGVVYHYRRTGSAWQMRAVLRPAEPTGVAGFGRALGRHGDRLLVGAPAADAAMGRAYLFRRETSGEWRQASQVRAPDGATERARFGSALLAAGDRVWIAAPGAQTVFAFARGPDDALSLREPLRASDATRGSDFGQALALAGTELWVGAPGVNRSNGTVYRFQPDGSGGWRAPVRIDADSADGTAWPFNFGHTIAAAGDHVVVGMPQRDFGEGRALAYTRRAGAWQAGQLLEGEIFSIGRALATGQRCEEGRMAGEFPCASIELVSHMPTSALGGARGAWVNDVWGWTDPETRRDYALVARRDGASFVDVTQPSQPRLIGSLPRTVGSPPSVWRDIKVIGTHAYIVSDGAAAHGMQVFDLTRLRAVTDTPHVFTPDATYREIASAHNVVADTASGYLYIVGANGGGETCGGGLHMVDARDPRNPRFAGCYNDTAGANPRGYTHDAQCLRYEGPDARYRGREICVGSNEREINIADVTDKANPVTIGRSSYPNVAYAHQGWFDREQRYFYMNDEGDELSGVVSGTRTLVWDLTRLDDPILAREYFGPVNSSDHNLFVRDNFVYEANYGSGLRILDISDRTNPREIGFFDSAPYNDDGPGHSATQSGAWSNYPFFESGIIVFTSVREGLFIVRLVRPIS